MTTPADLTARELDLLRRIVEGNGYRPTIAESVMLARLVNAGLVDIKKSFVANSAGVELSRASMLRLVKGN